MENFVIAVLEDGKPVSFYTSATSSTLEVAEDLQSALVIDNKALARAAMAAYQVQFPDKEVAVLPAKVVITLT